MITISSAGAVAVVSMQPFNEVALKLVKQVRPRSWDEVHLAWEIPANQVDDLASKLFASGHGVLIDDHPFDPAHSTQANPFLPLFTALPERLRDRVLFDLTMVLGPDLNPGGDRDLYMQMVHAHDLVQQADKVAERARQAKVRQREKQKVNRESQPVRRPVRRVS